MRSFVLSCFVLAIPLPAMAADEVKIEPVTIDGLLKAVEAHKGKIVVIDVWATFCIPCKEKFPHMVALANKHKKDGVVFISVALDDPENKDKALEFLKKQKATFQNFLLDDPLKNEIKGDDKLYHSIPPVLHVFDRAGKKVKTYEGKKEGEALDGQLLEMLKQK
ncbi:MAG: TlpA family protein disulfide reductase [Gemmataceae bacterium]|nr:TlpA family protein disulfide reductase [Gemmataceae bacterium]